MIDHLLRGLLGAFPTMIALTESERSDLEVWLRRPGAVYFVLGNPLSASPADIAALRPEQSDGTAVFIGRLHKRKRVEDFIAAATIAHERRWDDEYRVVGPDGGELALVQSAAERLPNLSYEGALTPEQVVERVARSSVFVLSSSKEPWGNVLATALALRKPVVVPESAALASEVVRLGAGVVYRDGDVEELATAVHASLVANERPGNGDPWTVVPHDETTREVLVHAYTRDQHSSRRGSKK